MNVKNILKAADEIEMLDYGQLRMGTWLDRDLNVLYDNERMVDIENALFLELGRDPTQSEIIDRKDEILWPHCDTVGCIAGWAFATLMPIETAHAMMSDPLIDLRMPPLAAELLGLDYSQAADLFNIDEYNENAGKAEAHYVLRILAETGKVDWPLAFEAAYDETLDFVRENGWRTKQEVELEEAE